MFPADKWIAGFGPESDARELALAALENRLAAVVYWLPAAAYCADHDVEHVHRLRVSTRRALAAIRLFDDWLPAKPARRVKKLLKKIRRAAGLARDLDVFLQRLGEHEADSSDLVAAESASRRCDAQPELERIADRLRHNGRFSRQVSKLLARIRRLGNEREDGAVVPLRAWASWRLAEVTDEFFRATPEQNHDTAALHKFRIQAKRLRYVIELVACGLDPAVRDVQYPLVEEVQDRLGKINDHAWAVERLKEWIAESSSDKQAQALRAVAAREAQELESALSEFQAWWTPERVDDLRLGLGCGSDRTPSHVRTILVS